MPYPYIIYWKNPNNPFAPLAAAQYQRAVAALADTETREAKLDVVRDKLSSFISQQRTLVDKLESEVYEGVPLDTIIRRQFESEQHPIHILAPNPPHNISSLAAAAEKSYNDFTRALDELMFLVSSDLISRKQNKNTTNILPALKRALKKLEKKGVTYYSYLSQALTNLSAGSAGSAFLKSFTEQLQLVGKGFQITYDPSKGFSGAHLTKKMRTKLDEIHQFLLKEGVPAAADLNNLLSGQRLGGYKRKKGMPPSLTSFIADLNEMAQKLSATDPQKGTFSLSKEGLRVKSVLVASLKDALSGHKVVRTHLTKGEGVRYGVITEAFSADAVKAAITKNLGTQKVLVSIPFKQKVNRSLKMEKLHKFDPKAALAEVHQSAESLNAALHFTKVATELQDRVDIFNTYAAKDASSPPIRIAYSDKFYEVYNQAHGLLSAGIHYDPSLLGLSELIQDRGLYDALTFILLQHSAAGRESEGEYKELVEESLSSILSGEFADIFFNTSNFNESGNTLLVFDFNHSYYQPCYLIAEQLLKAIDSIQLHNFFRVTAEYDNTSWQQYAAEVAALGLVENGHYSEEAWAYVGSKGMGNTKVNFQYLPFNLPSL